MSCSTHQRRAPAQSRNTAETPRFLFASLRSPSLFSCTPSLTPTPVSTLRQIARALVVSSPPSSRSFVHTHTHTLLERHKTTRGREMLKRDKKRWRRVVRLRSLLAYACRRVCGCVWVERGGRRAGSKHGTKRVENGKRARRSATHQRLPNKPEKKGAGEEAENGGGEMERKMAGRKSSLKRSV